MDNFTQEQIHDLAQRIAKLERGEEHTIIRLDSIDASLKDVDTKITTSGTQLTNLVGKIAKWEGKFGAIIFVAGCIWTFFVAMWGTILSYIKYTLGIMPAAGG